MVSLAMTPKFGSWLALKNPPEPAVFSDRKTSQIAPNPQGGFSLLALFAGLDLLIEVLLKK